MRILHRTVFKEVLTSALLGVVLFTFVLFLQRSGQLFEFLVRNSTAPRTAAYLFVLVFPQVIPFTVPLGVLVGILIALGRMSTDGEMTAMRAAGVPGRSVTLPIVVLATVAVLATAACSLWLTPWSIRERYRVVNQVLAAQLTAEVQPRVFEEQFPNTVLYVGDVIPTSGGLVRWRNIFMADVTPPGQRPPGQQDRGDGPRVTLAQAAIASPDVTQNRIQLSLINGSTYEVGKDVSQYWTSAFPQGDQILDAQKPAEMKATRPSTETDTLPLYRLAYGGKKADTTRLLEERIELHQRFALPLACLLLGIVGIPLGASSRKAEKSSAVVLTVALAFLYYMAMISLIGLARQGTVPVVVAVWTPNALFAIFGLVMMLRLEAPGDRDWVGRLRAWASGVRQAVRGTLQAPREGAILRRRPFLLSVLPQLLDTYVLTSFLFYFVMLLVSFVLMTHVFTFFELLSDMVKNRIPMSKMLTYLFFLTPKLIYDFTPFSVLVAVLVTFGVLTKHNEVTALKACGVSVYRLMIPVLITSSVLSMSLFAFDHYYVPEANRRQDALRNEIKGRPVQTYLNPERKWIVGEHNRIYYYRYFDPAENVMVRPSVFEIDPKTFTLTRHIQAEQARWEPALDTWVFQNGWSRDLRNGIEVAFHNYQGQTLTFPELNETPDYFVREVKEGKQMNFLELAAYIHGLQQSGFDTVPLQVQFYKKFSVPLFALIMAMVSIPFAFLAGNRGAMAGVGLSFAIAIAYWSVSQLFEQVGNVNQLPASVAAWSPDVIFSLAGLYFIARLRS